MATASVTLFVCFAVFGVFPKSQARTCWGPWINDHHPSPANNGTDKEASPIGNNLPAVCHDKNKTVIVNCRDEKGEPFRGYRRMNGYLYNFTVTCDDHQGLLCYAYNHTCPDFSIQAGCDCDMLSAILRSSTITPGVNNASTEMIANNQSTSSPQVEHGTSTTPATNGHNQSTVSPDGGHSIHVDDGKICNQSSSQAGRGGGRTTDKGSLGREPRGILLKVVLMIGPDGLLNNNIGIDP